MKKIILLLLILTKFSYSQIGGSNIFDLFNLPFSAINNSLGNKNISLYNSEKDLNSINPASLTPEANQVLSSNYSLYNASIDLFNIAYANSSNIGSFKYDLFYVGYGDIKRTDELGQELGNFSAYELAGTITYSKFISPKINMGIALKPIIQSYDSKNNIGLAVDFGIAYKHTENNNYTVCIRNMGGILKSYSENIDKNSNYEILLGSSIKLKNAPLRFSFTYHNLQKYNLSYTNDPEKKESSSNKVLEEDSDFDKFFKHIIVGCELIPSKSFFANLGYNFQRAYELNSDEYNAFSGLSWGFGVIFENFNFVYSGSKYNKSTIANLSFNINIGKL
jgi:hypothetical protein